MKIRYNSIMSILSITNRYYILRASSKITLYNFKEKISDKSVNKPAYNTDYFSIFELIKRK